MIDCSVSFILRTASYISARVLGFRSVSRGVSGGVDDGVVHGEG